MPIDWFPLWLSLRVAVVSTAVALAVGLWIAYILANREFRFKNCWTRWSLCLSFCLPPCWATICSFSSAAPARSEKFGK